MYIYLPPFLPIVVISLGVDVRQEAADSSSPGASMIILQIEYSLNPAVTQSHHFNFCLSRIIRLPLFFQVLFSMKEPQFSPFSVNYFIFFFKIPSIFTIFRLFL